MSEAVRRAARHAQIERDGGRYPEALAHQQEAVALARASGDVAQIAHTVRHLADILSDSGEPALAIRHFAEALALYRAHELDPGATANALRGAAVNADRLGDTAGALPLWREARDLYARLGIAAGVAEAEERIEALG